MKRFHVEKIRIFVVLSVLGVMLLGCDVYTNNIADKTKEVLQSNLNSDAKFAKYKMRVVDVKLVSESMSKYEGIAKIDFEGKTYDVPVSVSADLNNILIQTKPGGFIFLFEKDMSEKYKEIEQQMELLKEKFNQ